MWIIPKFVDKYVCSIDVVKSDHRHATSFIVSECVKSILKANDKIQCCPIDIVHYMRRKHGVSISYDKTWRGCEIALRSIRGQQKIRIRMP